MKNKSTTILSVVAVLVTVMCVTGPAGASPLPRPNLAGGAPTVVSYQGQVIVDGSPYNGTGFFKFAVVDAEGATSYWSNDGSSSDGGEPEASVSLTVTDGLFNVLLGDDALGMIELTAEAFGETGRYLRVWFSTDDGEFLLLTPDRRIAAMPYALQAEEAAYAADAANAGLLDGHDGSYYQARVSGACAVGSTVRAINADGTVVCQAGTLPNRAVAPTGNVSTTLDSGFTDDVGQYTSVIIGTDGLGLISYYDATNGDLKVAHCNDLACTSATLTALDSAGDVGQHTSVTIGTDGLGLISYYDATNGDLKAAHCDDPACTSATLVTLDSAGDVGQYTSVATGADGLGLISYYDVTNGDLKAAHCTDSACTSATLTPVDGYGSGGTAGQYSSLTIGADGLPWISYYYSSLGAVVVIRCDDAACTSITPLFDSLEHYPALTWEYTSLTVGADGMPLVSFFSAAQNGLMAAHEDLHCNNLGCPRDSMGMVDDRFTSVGRYTSITIGADGLGLITYYNEQFGHLMAAHCDDVLCTSATLLTLDNGSGTSYVGQYTSVTIGADGLPLVSYYDVTNGDLKVFHCASPSCAPYFRRR
jgi:hypothetical protein